MKFAYLFLVLILSSLVFAQDFEDITTSLEEGLEEINISKDRTLWVLDDKNTVVKVFGLFVIILIIFWIIEHRTNLSKVYRRL